MHSGNPRDAMPNASGTVVAFPFGPGELPVLRAEMGTTVQVHACESPDDLLPTVARVAPDLVLIAVRDRSAVSTAPVMRRIVREFPGTAVVAYCALTYADLHGAIAAGRVGVRHLAVRGYDGLRAVLRQVRCDAERRRVAEAVLDRLEPCESELVRWMVHHCVAHAHERPTVASVARARAVSVGTLTNHLRRDGFHTPGRIISWCRVLAAAAGLELPGRSAGRVAAELGYSNASELRMMLKRHTGLPLNELRARGSLAYAAARFHAVLRRPAGWRHGAR